MFRGKAGQAEARELAVGLYREHRSYLLRIARSNTKSMAVAEEALQEAFISFLRHFDPERGAPPIAWLTLTLKRECRRRQGREKWDRRAGQERERGEDVPASCWNRSLRGRRVPRSGSPSAMMRSAGSRT